MLCAIGRGQGFRHRWQECLESRGGLLEREVRVVGGWVREEAYGVVECVPCGALEVGRQRVGGGWGDGCGPAEGVITELAGEGANGSGG
ncbi:MAG: hypothetical protein RI897_3761 [Verrucomicrobiota bacterium]